MKVKLQPKVTFHVNPGLICQSPSGKMSNLRDSDQVPQEKESDVFGSHAERLLRGVGFSIADFGLPISDLTNLSGLESPGQHIPDVPSQKLRAALQI
jgi:hypothetical protein